MTSITTSKSEQLPGRGLAGSAAASDSELARASRGDAAPFGELYRRHFNRVYSYLLLRTGNIDDAQDLTSQTFMAALEGIGRFEGRGSFAAWLMGIALNKMAMHFRGRRDQASLDEVENFAYPAPALEDAVEGRRLLRLVRRALRGMTAERAEAFNLRAFSGLSAAEVAQVLGKSEAAVKMLVYRAFQDIRRQVCWEGAKENKG